MCTIQVITSYLSTTKRIQKLYTSPSVYLYFQWTYCFKFFTILKQGFGCFLLFAAGLSLSVVLVWCCAASRMQIRSSITHPPSLWSHDSDKRRLPPAFSFLVVCLLWVLPPTLRGENSFSHIITIPSFCLRCKDNCKDIWIKINDNKWWSLHSLIFCNRMMPQ